MSFRPPLGPVLALCSLAGLSTSHHLAFITARSLSPLLHAYLLSPLCRIPLVVPVLVNHELSKPFHNPKDLQLAPA